MEDIYIAWMECTPDNTVYVFRYFFLLEHVREIYHAWIEYNLYNIADVFLFFFSDSI
jgi:hypothetical protein